MRRFARILPLYWVCLAVVLAAWATGSLYRGLSVSPATVFTSIWLLPSRHLLVSVAWTLVFEMYFYYVFASWLRARRPEVVVIALPATLFVLSLFARLLPDGGVRSYLSDPIVYEFALGLGLAWWLRSGRRLPRSPLWALLGFSAAALASYLVPSATTAGLDHDVRFVLWGIPAALIVAAFLPLTQVRTRIGQLFCRLGDASYALYLTHGFVLIVYARVIKSGADLSGLPVVLWVALISLACVALGFAAHHLVERPLARRLRPHFH